MTSTVSSNACPQDLAHDNLAPLISTLGWIEAALAIKTIVARFLVQKFVVGKIEWNDWIMLFALLVALLNTTFINLSLYYGLGKH